jgi:hypothetical protein
MVQKRGGEGATDNQGMHRSVLRLKTFRSRELVLMPSQENVALTAVKELMFTGDLHKFGASPQTEDPLEPHRELWPLDLPLDDWTHGHASRTAPARAITFGR